MIYIYIYYIWLYIISYRIISYHIISYYIILYYICINILLFYFIIYIYIYALCRSRFLKRTKNDPHVIWQPGPAEPGLIPHTRRFAASRPSLSTEHLRWRSSALCGLEKSVRQKSSVHQNHPEITPEIESETLINHYKCSINYYKPSFSNCYNTLQ